MSQSIGAFEQDIITGRWRSPTYGVASIKKKAEELSAAHWVTLAAAR